MTKDIHAMTPFISQRPPPASRCFRSPAIDDAVRTVARDIADPELAWMFGNCFPNTLDTTVHYEETNGRPDAFVITGDIDAMWLRDSSAQVAPYLPFAKGDRALTRLFRGLIERQKRCIRLDPYANAFYREPKLGEWQDDLTEMRPGVHERKWELDSLCHALALACAYWRQTGDAFCLDREWQEVLALILDTLAEQQVGAAYRFRRRTDLGTETLTLAGFGNPTRQCGLVRSAFRPSDDACILPFLIPANAFLTVALGQAAEAAQTACGNAPLARRCRTLRQQVLAGIRLHAIHAHPRHGSVLAYEVDGYGGRIFMDDANIPSLLSLPYLGYCRPDHPLYRRTRRVVLGDDNPYFFRGQAGEGIGGPHVGLGMIWPMAIAMRAMTSLADAEILACLRTLKRTHAGTGFMHESFHQDDPGTFTRPWFGWVNSLFGELILKLHRERPHLLRQS